eukprot:gene11484-11277_t
MTSAVFLANDHEKGGDDPPKVVLKFMSQEDQYFREVTCRSASNLDEKYVVKILWQTDNFPRSDIEKVAAFEKFFKLPESKSNPFRYVIVMPAADRNLDAIYRTERPNPTLIKDLMRELALSIQSVHNSQLLHGDLKLLNILRVDKHIRLIDLDASAQLGDGYA